MKKLNHFRYNILVLFLLVSINSLSAKTIYYVSATGTGNGSSWSNAANNIQTMIDKAVPGDEVWVAKGTYYPTTETIARDARSRTFSIKSGVNLYGGFAGSESLFSQRALSDLNLDGKVDSCELVNTTILSGDIDGVADVWTKTINTNGTWKWTVSGNSGNCYHVVTANSKIDGFTVVGGNTSGSAVTDGGGINSISIINNCTVSNCFATNGGGIYSSSTNQSAFVSNCNISNCYASSNGGGIYSSSPHTGSYHYSPGYEHSPAFSYVSNCTVKNCSAGTYGGGIWNSSSSSLSYFSPTYSYVNNCIVNNCSAGTYGGGIYSIADEVSYSYVNNCIVNNCSAGLNGGGISSSNYSYSYSYVSNCTVKNCSSSTYGGGISNYNSTYTSPYTSSVSNCTVNNCSGGSGGGISNFDSSSPSPSSVNNCTVNNCSASSSGGGIFSSYPSSYVRNCASSNNSTNGTINIGITGGTQTGCMSPDITTTYNTPTSFVGIATTDAHKSELLTADWHLKEGSPCINAGTSTGLSTTILTGKDLDNNPRVLYATIDIGAYEYMTPKVAMPVMENFNNWTDFEKSDAFYRSAKINTMNDIKWTIVNQKADFSWQTNLTTTYSQPIFTYQIDGTKSSKVSLRYDMFFQAYAGTISPLGTEKLNVEFSTDLVTWSTISTYSNANGTIANQTYKQDISALAASKTFFIRFNANGVNTNRIEKWEIDNIIIDTDGTTVVNDGTTAVNTAQENKYKYSVNNGVLNIDNLGQKSLVQLYDVNGRLITTKNTDSQMNRFILPTHGVYIVKVVSDYGIQNKKIVW